MFSVIAVLMFLVAIFAFTHQAAAMSEKESSRTSAERIITLHDDGTDKGFITKKSTLREALKEQKIRLDSLDRTEPGLDEKLVASSYQVNVYRARPLIIRDGNVETKIISSYRTPRQIAAQAKLILHDEDETKLTPSSDPISDGAAEIMTVNRSTPVAFDFYGKTQPAYTMARTVGDMLKEKGIVMGQGDEITPSVTTEITGNMQIRLWRNGIQTVTLDEDVAFPTKKVANADQPIGYEKVDTPGEAGRRTVTYEINMQNGVEVSRKEINSVTTKQAVKEVKIVGTKPNGNGLSKAKGVMMYTDSKGVTHRETYYDLAMNVVMRNCGAGGVYTVRADGAKVDAEGYVLIAAHLGRYPRCSIVETSIGLGKVYDTGGFASVHPDGFDLATDWSNNNGI